MECLELLIPPLPQLITVNQVLYTEPYNHANRIIPLYDIIIVTKGTFYITEEGTEYTISPGSMLVLEPDKRHWGHQECLPGTELYYFHFQHPAPIRQVHGDDIQWGSVFPKPNHWDRQPCSQYMYIPKFTTLDTVQLIPLLNQMVYLRSEFTLENLLPLQTLLGQLFVILQKIASMQMHTRSYEVTQLVIQYLRANMDKPFRLGNLSDQLNFHVDHLSKCLKKHTGMTPIQYLNRLRIEKAKLLLEQTDLTLQQISENTGITDYNYFFRLFRKHSGISPSQYRLYFKNHRQ